MPRRRCCGLVYQEPQCRQFMPETKTDAPPVVLYVEEFEAMRLKDLQKLDQETCANSMNISRATFQRILHSAREKIAFALVNSQKILIKGGSYMVKNRVFECQNCKHVWEVEPCSEGGKHGYEIACPKCNNMNKMKINEDGVKHACAGHGHKHEHGKGCCGH